MKDFIFYGLFMPFALLLGGSVGWLVMDHVYHRMMDNTQPAIQTVIVTVRGCDVVQYIQGDKLITAHNAADQPKSCKVRHVK